MESIPEWVQAIAFACIATAACLWSVGYRRRLNPCKCGTPPEITGGGRLTTWTFRVVCGNCCRMTRLCRTIPEAVKAWNSNETK